MVSASFAVSSVLFPPLPERLAAEYHASGLRLRRFGAAPGDLTLDFSRPTPQVVTELIASCAERLDGGAVDRRLFGQLRVGARIACLLLLAGLEALDSLNLVLRCPAPPCGEQAEVDLAVDEVLALAPMDTVASFDIDVFGQTVTLRLPTGDDQIAWLRAGFPDAATAREGILRSLMLSPLPEVMPAGWAQALETALDEHDPLVCFSVNVSCPFCEASNSHDVALADLALRVLRGAQSRLIESVHRIASRYAWTEAEVASIPPWRRERYLALIESGGA